jgi:hypothetical protein
LKDPFSATEIRVLFYIQFVHNACVSFRQVSSLNPDYEILQKLDDLLRDRPAFQAFHSKDLRQALGPEFGRARFLTSLSELQLGVRRRPPADADLAVA